MQPLIIFDLETTGTDIVLDKIVQFAAIKVNPKTWVEIEEAKNILINPGRPIPAEATEIHGIKDEDVAGRAPFKSYSKSMHSWLTGCDFGGYNIIQFDIPFLAEEFATCGLSWPQRGAKYYDGLHVFREKEKRDLTGAMRFYCNESHQEAHDALADVRAAARVISEQMFRYEDIQTPEQYSQFCENPNALDLAGKLELNKAGVAVYAFGKDKGKGIKENPGFGYWMLKQKFPTNTVNILKSIMFS